MAKGIWCARYVYIADAFGFYTVVTYQFVQINRFWCLFKKIS
jgi:hypothetical protein